MLDAKPRDKDHVRRLPIQRDIAVVPRPIPEKLVRLERKHYVRTFGRLRLPIPSAKIVRDRDNPGLGPTFEGLTNALILRPKMSEAKFERDRFRPVSSYWTGRAASGNAPRELGAPRSASAWAPE